MSIWSLLSNIKAVSTAVKAMAPQAGGIALARKFIDLSSVEGPVAGSESMKAARQLSAGNYLRASMLTPI